MTRKAARVAAALEIGGAAEAIRAVAADADGNTFVVADINGAVDVEGGSGTASLDTEHGVLILKYDSLGDVEWHTNISGSLSGSAMSVGPGGDVYAAGRIYGRASVDVGQDDIHMYGEAAGFVARIASAGGFEWSRVYGSETGFVEFDSIALLANDTLASGGSFDKGLAYRTGSMLQSLSSIGGADAFLMRTHSRGPTLSDPGRIVVQEGSTQVSVLAATLGTALAGGQVRYEISGGADADRFTLDPDTGQLVFSEPPFASVPTDANLDNVYELEVTSVDSNRQRHALTTSVSVV